MKFGFVGPASEPWPSQLANWQYLERLGYDSIWYSDHLLGPTEESANTPWREGWTMLTAMAAVVPRVRFGLFVGCTPLRHPAMVAKLAATLDEISGGRLILALGAGDGEFEQDAYGIPFSSMKDRLARLDEACEVIKSLFTQDRTNFNGRFFTFHNAYFEPKPIQKPLPLMLAGIGEKIMLRLVAKHADMWNVAVLGPAQIAHKIKVLHEHCGAIGRNPAEIQLTGFSIFKITDDPKEARRSGDSWTGMTLPMMTGDAIELRGILAEYRKLGLEMMVMSNFEPDRKKQQKRFIEEVASAVS